MDWQLLISFGVLAFASRFLFPGADAMVDMADQRLDERIEQNPR